MLPLKQPKRSKAKAQAQAPLARVNLATKQEMDRVTTRIPDELYSNIMQYMSAQSLDRFKSGSGAFGAAARKVLGVKFAQAKRYIERLIKEPITPTPFAASVNVHMKDGRAYSYGRQLSNDPFTIRILGSPDTISLMVKAYAEDGGSFHGDPYALDAAVISADLESLIMGHGNTLSDIAHVDYTVTDLQAPP